MKGLGVLTNLSQGGGRRSSGNTRRKVTACCKQDSNDGAQAGPLTAPPERCACAVVVCSRLPGMASAVCIRNAAKLAQSRRCAVLAPALASLAVIKRIPPEVVSLIYMSAPHMSHAALFAACPVCQFGLQLPLDRAAALVSPARLRPGSQQLPQSSSEEASRTDGPFSSGGSASSMTFTRGTISTNVGRCAGTCDMHATANSCR